MLLPLRSITCVYRPVRLLITTLLLVTALIFANSPGSAKAAAISSAIRAAVLVPVIHSKVPHDTTSFTEGLVLLNGHLYESAGLTGQSSLREEDVQTGGVLRRVALPPKYFGEGIAVDDQRLVQLTWQDQLAIVYDVNTFKQAGTLTYSGEGWGLCFDGQQFYMSNGSSSLVARDPVTFAVTRTIPVTLDGRPIDQLNELECVGDSVYANVWLTHRIVRIDKTSGQVTARIEVPANILTAQEQVGLDLNGVLNGIAYDPGTQEFLITGKLWPWLFWVTFAPASYSYF
jgi:glutaminyl-peptide cyclotransferase